MTDDLERDLRAMLAERVNDVRSVPTQLLIPSEPRVDAQPDHDGEVIELGLRLGDVATAARRHWPVLLAAAVVLAAVGSVLALLVGAPKHHAVPPARHPELKTVVRPSCRAAVPASWKRAIAARPSVTGIDATDVQAVTPSGGLVLQLGVTSRAHFAYLAPGSTSPRSLGTFSTLLPAGSAGISGFALDADSSTLLVTTESGRQTASPRQITAVDLRTGRHTVLATVATGSSRRIVNQAYVHDGTAYWQTTSSTPTKGSALHDAIVARTVTGGPEHVVARGDVYLEKSALGISWNTDEGTADRPADVPALVSRNADIDSEPNEVFDSYISDGSVYAWQTLHGALDWYDPATDELVTVPRLLGVPGIAPGQASLFAVAGPLVYFQNQRGDADLVIDVRTGAVVHGGQTTPIYGVRGTLVGDRSAFDPSGNTSSLFRIRAIDLPPAGC